MIALRCSSSVRSLAPARSRRHAVVAKAVASVHQQPSLKAQAPSRPAGVPEDIERILFDEHQVAQRVKELAR